MSNIEWTGQSWNPIVGCSIKSTGCKVCYAMPMAARLAAMGIEQYKGLTEKTKTGAVWTGKIAFAKSVFEAPLKRKKPETYFVNSMGDLFHEDVPFAWVDKVFAVIALCPHHIFQILTKRSDRMLEYMRQERCDEINSHAGELMDWQEMPEVSWPPANAWMGVSAENQDRWDERVPDLLKTPAAIRWVSVEPMLEHINAQQIFLKDEERIVEPLTGDWQDGVVDAGDRLVGVDSKYGSGPKVDWLVCGGESGHRARPFKTEWMQSLLEQAKASGTAFFAKQTGGASKSKLPEIPADLLIREFPKREQAA